MSKNQDRAPAPPNVPAYASTNPSTYPPGVIWLNEKKEHVFRILNEKNIIDIVSNLRTKKENTDLKNCNYKLNKLRKSIVEVD